MPTNEDDMNRIALQIQSLQVSLDEAQFIATYNTYLDNGGRRPSRNHLGLGPRISKARTERARVYSAELQAKIVALQIELSLLEFQNKATRN